MLSDRPRHRAGRSSPDRRAQCPPAGRPTGVLTRRNASTRRRQSNVVHNGDMEELPGPRDLVALLAEPDRLRALAAVTLGASTLPEVAERTGLEPRAAARALSRLVAGGLLEGEAGKGYRVRTEALQAAARRPADTGSAVAGAGGSEGQGGRPPGPAAGSPEADVLRRVVPNRRLLA